MDSANTIYEEMRSVFRPLLDAQARIKELAAAMERHADHGTEEYAGLSAEYGRLLAYFEANDGYNIGVKIKTVLNGMGFADREMDTVCGRCRAGKDPPRARQAPAHRAGAAHARRADQPSGFPDPPVAGGLFAGIQGRARRRVARPLFLR
ncbi:MAG: hypothetical protein ACLVL7_05735 [Anaerotruncus massiliensis (ex Togo et al. 2019)]